MGRRETMDVVGYLAKQPGPERVLNTDGPMTRSAAGYFAERMRQLGYNVRITRHRKGAQP